MCDAYGLVYMHTVGLYAHKYKLYVYTHAHICIYFCGPTEDYSQAVLDLSQTVLRV